MPDPEGWPSVFFHPELKLLLVVYVDDFKMAGPIESMSKGWKLIDPRLTWTHPGKLIDILVAIMYKKRTFFFLKMITHLPTFLTNPCLTQPRKPPLQRTGRKTFGKSSQDMGFISDTTANPVRVTMCLMKMSSVIVSCQASDIPMQCSAHRKVMSFRNGINTLMSQAD